MSTRCSCASTLTGEPSLRELLGRIRRIVLGAFEHTASFEKLLEEIQPRRVQANFVHLADPAPTIRLPDLDLVTLDTPPAAILGEWTVAVIETGADTKISFAYNADLFDMETVDRALDVYHALLEAMVRPDALETSVTRLSFGTTSEPEDRAGLAGEPLAAARGKRPLDGKLPRYQRRLAGR